LSIEITHALLKEVMLQSKIRKRGALELGFNPHVFPVTLWLYKYKEKSWPLHFGQAYWG
jgi:hypothetical protein